MVNPANYFDLYDVFVNEISGGLYIFVALAVILLVYYGTIKYNVPFTVSFMLTALFFLIIGISQDNIIFYMLPILLAATFYYFASKAIKQG